MGKKEKAYFVCQNCGHAAIKWMGRCPACGEWGSMVEEMRSAPPTEGRRATAMGEAEPLSAISLAPELRLKTGLSEFDRTLGGGVVPGSLILIGGDPGIGKSTLLLQVLDRLARQGYKALYLSGEESAQQIKLRAERLGICADDLYVVTGTCIEAFMDRLTPLRPDVVAVDSIQTLYTEDMASAPGSVGQVREAASRLMTYAKGTGTPVFLVGHVTKDGSIAGPKVLEHLVDTVLYFEGDRGHLFRILRAVKNRFGSTNEIGVFEMKDSGLEAVGNPSKIFLEERPEDVPGSAVIPCMEGTRPLLVEIQALVGPSPLGMPRRTAIGVDPNRISLLVAVLGKRVGMELGDQDIFVNVAGGLKVDEPAADLGIVSAMVSSYLSRPIRRDLIVFGEVGLAGEVRAVNHPGLRLNEAEKLGFLHAILPRSSLEGLKSPHPMTIVGVGSVQDLYDRLFL